MKSREIEVQLQFLKAKQLEFLKDQHQKQAVALAAAQVAAVAGMCLFSFVKIDQSPLQFVMSIATVTLDYNNAFIFSSTKIKMRRV